MGSAVVHTKHSPQDPTAARWPSRSLLLAPALRPWPTTHLQHLHAGLLGDLLHLVHAFDALARQLLQQREDGPGYGWAAKGRSGVDSCSDGDSGSGGGCTACVKASTSWPHRPECRYAVHCWITLSSSPGRGEGTVPLGLVMNDHDS